ncbi:MAG TPA: hypothetical protein VKC66_20110 [Xanthobacteraceae bacterium]|nr:hypothetical protein [Xanthobacteraceae bacterium]
MHPRDEIPDRARVGFGHLPLAFDTGLLDLTTGEPLPWRTTGILLNEHIADDGPTGKAPEELDWTDAQRQKRAVAGYLAALEAEAGSKDETERGDDDGSDGGRESRSDRKAPEVISPGDPSWPWTGKAHKQLRSWRSVSRATKR